MHAEWPERGIKYRIECLNFSCDTLPISLVMICDENQSVLGHIRIEPIASKTKCGYIRSVIIDPKLRMQGLGKIMMKYAEQYCREFLQLHTIYLTSIDREEFYKKLNYEICTQSCIYGVGNCPPPSPRQQYKTYMKKSLK